MKSGSGYEVWSLTESLTSSSDLDTCFFFKLAAGHFQGKASSLKVHQISTPVNVTQRLEKKKTAIDNIDMIAEER
ncbi:hypothetical protein L2E82_31965 [Cichorium intybus]|uniref:Uncharacterized protein n=1 Tax=Cichorium intybus TaxID=13427 RepID=A0ACB9BFF2_CICIN|nr:hypothetical protein L2E82_31965 [Cichorium intybus]